MQKVKDFENMAEHYFEKKFKVGKNMYFCNIQGFNHKVWELRKLKPGDKKFFTMGRVTIAGEVTTLKLYDAILALEEIGIKNEN
jgi:ASC-1-like (ASCH) protein